LPERSGAQWRALPALRALGYETQKVEFKQALWKVIEAAAPGDALSAGIGAPSLGTWAASFTRSISIVPGKAESCFQVTAP
jgi:hypothetical protein